MHNYSIFSCEPAALVDSYVSNVSVSKAGAGNNIVNKNIVGKNIEGKISWRQKYRGDKNIVDNNIVVKNIVGGKISWQ